MNKFGSIFNQSHIEILPSFLPSYVTLFLLIIISCPLMASVLVLVSTGLLFSSALICQLLLIKEVIIQRPPVREESPFHTQGR